MVRLGIRGHLDESHELGQPRLGPLDGDQLGDVRLAGLDARLVDGHDLFDGVEVAHSFTTLSWVPKPSLASTPADTVITPRLLMCRRVPEGALSPFSSTTTRRTPVSSCRSWSLRVRTSSSSVSLL